MFLQQLLPSRKTRPAIRKLAHTWAFGHSIRRSRRIESCSTAADYNSIGSNISVGFFSGLRPVVPAEHRSL